MRKFLFLAALFLSISHFLSAQDGNLRDEILTYKDTVGVLIDGGRNLIIKKLEANDIEKVREVRDYLWVASEPSPHQPFRAEEDKLLLYITGGYRDLLSSFTNNDSTYKHKWPVSYPQYDAMRNAAFNYLKKNKTGTISAINNAPLSPEEKAVLILDIRHRFVWDQRNHEQNQKELNAAADSFLSSYPNSPYEHYIRYNIRFVYKLNRWGGGMDFFTGVGFFDGKLSNLYGPPGIFGVAFEITCNQFSFYLRDHIAITKTRVDQPVGNDIWDARSQANLLLPEISVGYRVVDKKVIKFAPYAGIASTSISPPTNRNSTDNYPKDAGQNFTRTFVAGINADIRLGKNTASKLNPQETAGLYLRLRYGYAAPAFEYRYPGISGHYQYISVGISVLGRNSKRQY